MTHKPTPALAAEPAEDRLGRPIYRIPLSGRDGAGRYAITDEIGLERLRAAGAKSLFLINDGQGRDYVSWLNVRTRRTMTAARAILGDPQGRRAEHLNGDRLDIRRANLRGRQYAGVGASRAPRAAA